MDYHAYILFPTAVNITCPAALAGSLYGIPGYFATFLVQVLGLAFILFWMNKRITREIARMEARSKG